jgi:non-ribosomal peptide synthetase-like protein
MTDTLLHELFERTAARHPDQVAVETPAAGVGARELVTYRALDRQANALARTLAPHTRKDGIVAIWLPRERHHLYLAQLATLKAGLAYTCIDPLTPDERAAEVMRDARPVAILTCPALEHRARKCFEKASIATPPILDVAELAHREANAPPPRTTSARDLCYVIYTSGTTGKPKGVMIEHAGVVHLAACDAERFGLGVGDRVGQSSSPAYDSSVEEIWLAFAVGATLVVMNDDVVRRGPDLVPWLRDERITVFCPPPTLLRAMACPNPHEALPQLRLLYVGGEALPQDLADRFARGRHLENGYGPTECTVTALRTRVREGEPVTIGRAIPGNDAHVLDPTFSDVPDGAEGELFIGGIGLARGYLDDPELTARRFIHHPRYGRLYRTGDLVRRLPSGDHEYMGRADAQVKIRGHRVELGDVESHLAALPGLRAAACVLSGAHLVAFVVPERVGDALDPAALRSALARALPDHMVPARIHGIDALPTSTSGKLDRRSLTAIAAAHTPAQDSRSETRATPSDEWEARLFAEAEGVLGVTLGPDDDFFDRGGDSLSAARLVSALRRDPRTASLTVRDVYEARTIAALATRLRANDHTPLRGAHPRPRKHPAWATLFQSVWLAGELVAVSLALYAGFFLALPWLLGSLGLIATLWLLPLVRPALALAFLPVTLAHALFWKKLLIGRSRPGVYPVWGSEYLRHFIVSRAARRLPWGLAEGTELKNVLLRCLGARIGRRVHLPGDVIPDGAWDLLDIGDDVSLGLDAELRLVDYADHEMIVGPIRIGDGATLETRAGLGPGASLGRNAYLTALSMVPAHARVPDGECWDGVPATRASLAPEPPLPQGRKWHSVPYSIFAIGSRVLFDGLSALPGLALATSLLLSFDVDASTAQRWLFAPDTRALEVVIGLAVVVGWLVSSVFAKAILARWLGRVRPGVIAWHGPAHLRVWLKARAVDAAGQWLSGTLFWPAWLRLAGMRVGKRCEVSTILGVTPELVTLASECFFADGIYLGPPRVHRGTVELDAVSFEPNTFLGNHVVIPAGTHLPRDVLLGVCTVADDEKMKEGSSWFGHPPFVLPHREVVTIDRRLTHDPSWIRYVNRWLWEAARFVLPVVPALLLLFCLKTIQSFSEGVPAAAFLFGVIPAYALGVILVLAATVWAAKWTLLGRVRPGQHALWSCWCSRWDFLYVLWGFYVGRALSPIEGTQLVVPWLRAMGVTIGQRVFLAGGFVQVVDPDMLTFEDDTTVACHFQAHSFEDRVLKIGRVYIRRGASAGRTAVLLYGADVGEGTRVGEHSVLMKHERLLPSRYYVGCPSRASREP